MSKISDLTGIKRNILAGVAGAALSCGAVPAAAVDFSGQAHESIFVRTNEVATTLNEGPLAVVPSTLTGNFVVPASDSDLFTLQFSAQVELQNASSVVGTFNNDDSLDLQAQVVNAATGAVIIMRPAGLTSFAGDNNPEAHSMAWAVRLQTGTWRFRIMGDVQDRGTAAVVRALLTNWTMIITRYN